MRLAVASGVPGLLWPDPCSATSKTGIRNRALITVLYRAGRISEALALRPADVDPERGTVQVMDGKGHKPRTVGLDPGAMATIQRWADKRREAGIRTVTNPRSCQAGDHRRWRTRRSATYAPF